ncbi:hypothetical protein L249_5166 [Ophiocordyceps polyrhachis-furcata BCC 54312]|uniref:Uncharacterized protein n=1 Tax=Ophiocordyceps polyrhachis-furcata BCC 54312 TaxID=1330021 RepID=A0A367L934_9HYPO|nr:hypothetical protein L249_5166 [Ophiocordyceps polyrhachis-furcata BCC 54312]
MADPLSMAASLIAVAQISGSIVSLCYYYIHGFQGANKEITKLLGESQSLRSVVEQLIQLVDKHDAESDVHLRALRETLAHSGLSEFQSSLKDLEGRLQFPVSKWQRLGAKLLWPLRERDVIQALESIHRMKSVFEFGLLTDATGCVVEMRRDIKDLISRFERIHLMPNKQRLQVLLDWLQAPDPSVLHHKLFKKRVAETGRWLLETEDFQQWIKGESSSLWLYGIAGCGKSVLSSVVIEEIKSRQGSQGGNIALAYHHFDFSNDASSRTETMLRSLVSQLSAWKGEPPAALEKGAENYHPYDDAIPFLHYKGRENTRFGVGQPNTYDLVKILLGIGLEFGQVYLVLDALDECFDREELLRILPSILGGETGFRVFVTSRHMADIAAVLSSHAASSLEAVMEDVDRDIDTFVRDRLTNHPKLSKWRPQVRNEIQASLVSGAKGMFRWADCQINTLGKCFNLRELRKAIRKLPKSLSDTYQQALLKVDENHWEYAIRTLMWLAVSPKPLRIEEAVDILAVDFEESEEWPVFSEDLRVCDAMEVPEVCGSLVSTMTSYIQEPDGSLAKSTELRLAHYTVKEYLLSDDFFSQFPRPMLFSNVSDSYAVAAKTSLAYISSLDDTLTQLSDRPLSRHAAEFWLYYNDLSPKDSRISHMIIKLLGDSNGTEPYRNWCRLFDPTRPWLPPNLERQSFPSPLYYTCSQGLLSETQMLLQNGASPNATGEFYGTCLQAAAFNGHVEIVRCLLLAGADPAREGGVYFCPIIAAAASGVVGVVECLLEYGADPNKLKSHPPDTFALMEAVRRNHVDVVEALLNGGANPDFTFYKAPVDHNCMDAALSRGFKDCAALILPRMSKWAATESLEMAFWTNRSRDTLRHFGDFIPDEVLAYAATSGYEDVVVELLDQGAKPYMCDVLRWLTWATIGYDASNMVTDVDHSIDLKNGYALIGAARGGFVDTVRLLLARGDDVNAACKTVTALTMAAYEGHREVVQVLLDHGASLREGIRYYGSPAHAAVLGDHADIIELLLAEGVDIETTAHCGKGMEECTLLQLAASSSNADIVDWLLDHGADPNAGAEDLDKHGVTALSRACKNDRSVDLVTLLIKAGAKVKAKSRFPDKMEEPPLHTAVRYGSVETVRALAEHGADVNEQCNDGWTALHKAAKRRKQEAADITEALLFELGGDWTLPLANGSLPIHMAASHDNTPCLEPLVRAGSDVNARNHAGRTPLHWAADNGALTAVEWLLDHGAASHYEEHGTAMTALDYAELRLREASYFDKKNTEAVRDALARHASQASKAT